MLGAGDHIVGISVGRPGAGGAQLEGLGGGARHPVVLAHNHVAGAVLQQVHPGKQISIFSNEIVRKQPFLILTFS